MINKSYFIEGPQLSPQSVMMGKSCLKQRQKEEMLRLVDNCKYCYEDNLITKEVPDHAGWRKRICNCSWICCSKGEQNPERIMINRFFPQVTRERQRVLRKMKVKIVKLEETSIMHLIQACLYYFVLLLLLTRMLQLL